jgi:hypothetical protein
VPLAQDAITVDERATGTITGDMPRLGSRVDFSRFAGTFTPSVSVTVYGSLTLSNDPGFSWGGTASLILAGRDSQTLTTSGKTIPGILRMEAPNGAYKLQDDLTVGGAFTYTLGAFDANDHDVTLASLSSTTGNNDRTLLMRSGRWTLTGTGTVWATTTNTALTLDPGTSTIVIADTTSATKTFIGNGRTYHDLTFNGGSGALVMGGSTFATITWAPGSTVTLTSDTTTTVSDLTAVGTDSQPITVSATTHGTAAALRKFGGTVAADWLVLSDSTATGTAQWFAGHNSIDGGNNLGWQFANPTAGGNAFFMFLGGSGNRGSAPRAVLDQGGVVRRQANRASVHLRSVGQPPDLVTTGTHLSAAAGPRQQRDRQRTCGRAAGRGPKSARTVAARKFAGLRTHPQQRRRPLVVPRLLRPGPHRGAVRAHLPLPDGNGADTARRASPSASTLPTDAPRRLQPRLGCIGTTGVRHADRPPVHRHQRLRRPQLPARRFLPRRHQPVDRRRLGMDSLRPRRVPHRQPHGHRELVDNPRWARTSPSTATAPG